MRPVELGEIPEARRLNLSDPDSAQVRLDLGTGQHHDSVTAPAG